MATPPNRIDQLWLEYKRTHDERLKEQLVLACMRRVHAIAKDLRAKFDGAPKLHDLVAAGALGLMQAFDRFDPTRGVRFETWCHYRVLGAMQDDQRRELFASDAIRLKTQRLRRAAEEMTAANGRAPTDEELATALAIPIAEIARLWRHLEHRKPVSLDSAHAETAPDSDRALQDHRQDPVRQLLAREARTRLLDSLKALPEKQRLTILLYYYDKLNMAQIGTLLDVSQSRVSQLHTKALETLARRLGPRKDEFLDALGG